MSTNLASLYGSLYGPLYFATIMSSAFYGITCMQTFFYYVHYRNDPLRVKILVSVMWALNTIHEALTVAGVYKDIIAGLLNPSAFILGNPELVLLFLFSVLVSIPTQGFFVYRIYLFSGRNIAAPIVFVVLAVVQLACAVVDVANSLNSKNDAQLSASGALDGKSSLILTTICFSVASGIDILVAIFMTFLLIQKRSAAGFGRSAHVLQRLTIFAVNTGTWTATFAFLSLVFLYVYPSNLIYAIFAIPLCSIYCNTLLANLNARAYIRAEASTYNHVHMDLLSTGPQSRMSDGIKVDKRHGDVSFLSCPTQGIWKTTEVSTFRDADLSTSTPAVNV